jgi:O-antigen ligase
LKIGTAQIPSDELSGAGVGLVYFLMGMCAGYAILKLTRTKKNLIWLVSSAAWSLIIASGFGLFQFRNYRAAGESATRISGSSGNPNYFAAYLALGAVVMFLCWRLKFPGSRLYLLATITTTAACILTFSRMGTVACLLGLTLTVQLTRIRKAVNWKLIVLSVIALTVLVGLTRSYIAYVRNSLPNAGNSDRTDLAVASQEAEDLTRLEAVQFAFQQFLEQPVFGVGFATIAERNYAATGLYVTTHDTYAQILAGTGIVGGALIVLMVTSVFGSLSQTARRYAVPAAAELAFCSFFIDLLQSIEMFVILAILLAVLRSHRQLAEPTSIPRDLLLGNSACGPMIQEGLSS